MLTNLKINNVAIIKESEIIFQNGLTVFSGETGAGKSIIIKALKFAIGGKADKSLIRANCQNLKVELIFDNIKNNVINICENFGIQIESELLISRTLNVNGKSDIRINGCMVTLAMLNEITKSLIDCYSQSEHYSLITNEKQIEVLDTIIESNISCLKQKLKELLNEFKNNENLINMKQLSINELEKQSELLNFEINEIEENMFDDGEYDELCAKKQKIQSLLKISESLNASLGVLSTACSGSSLSNAVKEAMYHIKGLEKYDDSYNDLVSRLDNLRYEIDDITDILEEKMSGDFFTEAEIDAIENRYNNIRKLKKKYGETAEDVESYLIDAQTKLKNLQNNNENIEVIKERQIEIERNILDLSKKINFIRVDNAKYFSEKIIKELKELDIKNANFKINIITHINDKNFMDYVTPNGLDEIEFMFSANLGQPLKPLAKVISGGELSRFMLAYKNVAFKTQIADVLIFDEIDSGISGETASVVAQKIFQISKYCQVLSISHLPQIIAMADYNVYVRKDIINNETVSNAIILNDNNKVKEVARVVGDNNISNANLVLANELIEKAKKFKQSINNN